MSSSDSRWKIEGHYPRRDFQSDEYNFEQPYTETNINKLSCKIINCTLSNQAVCSYADFTTSGQLTAKWLSDIASSKAARLQKHDCIELLFVEKGIVSGIMEYQPFTMQAGDVLLVNPNLRNLYYFGEGNIIISLSMTNTFFKSYFYKNGVLRLTPSLFYDFVLPNLDNTNYPNREYICFRQSNNGKIDLSELHTVHHLYDELRKKEPGYDAIIVGLLTRLFHHLADSGRYQIEKGSYHVQTRQELCKSIKDYLDQNKRRITRQELSEHFHFNGEYLCRIFKEQMKESIHNYNQTCYMREALSLLQNTNLSIEKIAWQTGFTSRSQFYRVFHDFYGKNPSYYRK